MLYHLISGDRCEILSQLEKLNILDMRDSHSINDDEFKRINWQYYVNTHEIGELSRKEECTKYIGEMEQSNI
jgi:ribosomal protein L14E/L6E/L27E